MIGTGPWLIVLAGINGAGKSTTANMLRRDPALTNARFLNPDEETATFLRDDPSLSLEAAEYRGLRSVLLDIQALMAARATFVTETVFANNTYLKLIQTAKSMGYGVSIVFVGVPTVEHAIARVAARVGKGGHNVREADIRRRWPIAHRNLARAVAIADKITVFDNSGYGGEPRVLAKVRGGKIEILDRTALTAVTAALEA